MEETGVPYKIDSPTNWLLGGWHSPFQQISAGCYIIGKSKRSTSIQSAIVATFGAIARFISIAKYEDVNV
jgi:hypothetical protein